LQGIASGSNALQPFIDDAIENRQVLMNIPLVADD
jgi:hypothetical protein